MYELSEPRVGNLALSDGAAGEETGDLVARDEWNCHDAGCFPHSVVHRRHTEVLAIRRHKAQLDLGVVPNEDPALVTEAAIIDVEEDAQGAAVREGVVVDKIHGARVAHLLGIDGSAGLVGVGPHEVAAGGKLLAEEQRQVAQLEVNRVAAGRLGVVKGGGLVDGEERYLDQKWRTRWGELAAFVVDYR